jgi:hypothetical protein
LKTRLNVGKREFANIGPKEARKRLFMGVAMLAMGVVLAVIFTRAGVSRGWYAVLFLPFWMGTLPVCEARKKT